MDPDIFESLFKAALTVRDNSYSPISRFKVGSALRSGSGAIYAGTNAEEPSFNHSIHAEESAIAQMIAAEGANRITALVVIGGEADNDVVCSPCGHCRQLLAEFAPDDLPVIVAGPDQSIRLETTLGILLPFAFRLGNLGKN